MGKSESDSGSGRDERLKAALRDNLRRRRAQAEERAAAPEATGLRYRERPVKPEKTGD